MSEDETSNCLTATDGDDGVELEEQLNEKVFRIEEVVASPSLEPLMIKFAV